MATIDSYFKPKETVLPPVNGSLLKRIPSSSLQLANQIVSKVIVDDEAKSSCLKPTCGEYAFFTPEEKAKIVKCAMECGVTRAMRKLSKEFPARSLKESSVHLWMNKYKDQLKRTKVSGEQRSTSITIENKKRGRPLLLGEELDEQVKLYITALCDNGAVVNSAIVIACAEGLVKSRDANLLEANGGHLTFSKSWAQSFLQQMGFVKRRATTKSKVLVSDFDDVKKQFLFDIKAVTEMEEIPNDLIIN